MHWENYEKTKKNNNFLPCNPWAHFQNPVSVLAQLDTAHETCPLAAGRRAFIIKTIT